MQKTCVFISLTTYKYLIIFTFLHICGESILSATKPNDSITAIFLNILQTSRFLVDEVIADGEFHRVPLADDSPNERSGTYILSLENGVPLGGMWRGKKNSQWYLWELKSQQCMSDTEKKHRKNLIKKMNAYSVVN